MPAVHNLQNIPIIRTATEITVLKNLIDDFHWVWEIQDRIDLSTGARSMPISTSFTDSPIFDRFASHGKIGVLWKLLPKNPLAAFCGYFSWFLRTCVAIFIGLQLPHVRAEDNSTVSNSVPHGVVQTRLGDATNRSVVGGLTVENRVLSSDSLCKIKRSEARHEAVQEVFVDARVDQSYFKRTGHSDESQLSTVEEFDEKHIELGEKTSPDLRGDLEQQQLKSRDSDHPAEVHSEKQWLDIRPWEIEGENKSTKLIKQETLRSLLGQSSESKCQTEFVNFSWESDLQLSHFCEATRFHHYPLYFENRLSESEGVEVIGYPSAAPILTNTHFFIRSLALPWLIVKQPPCRPVLSGCVSE